MAKEQKYTGFLSYLETHTYTPEFIHDYEYWCRRIFKGWNLFVEFDTFYSICWEALLSKIDEFNPERATIQTFCISRINNEAWRLYMKNKSHKSEVDSDDPVVQISICTKNNFDVYEMFIDFVSYANRLGVTVNVKELYEEYTSGEETPALIAFASWRAKRNDIGGRNDIQKGK